MTDHHDATADARPQAPSLADEPINILLVDDEPRNLTVLETVLADPGYRLVRAESADEALLALVLEEFALIVLDIRMPGMTGFELADTIKQRKKTAGVPIIFLTAYYNEDQHMLEGYRTGAVDYLHKPGQPHHSALQGRGLRRPAPQDTRVRDSQSRTPRGSDRAASRPSKTA